MWYRLKFLPTVLNKCAVQLPGAQFRYVKMHQSSPSPGKHYKHEAYKQ
jgi:hypothetical protein